MTESAGMVEITGMVEINSWFARIGDESSGRRYGAIPIARSQR